MTNAKLNGLCRKRAHANFECRCGLAPDALARLSTQRRGDQFSVELPSFRPRLRQRNWVGTVQVSHDHRRSDGEASRHQIADLPLARCHH